MLDELPLLIKLQQHDIVIDDLKQQAESVTPLIQKKNQQIDGLKTALKTSKEKSISFQSKKKQLELDADAKEKLVQKHQSELGGLKSNDAYKAMLVEIQAAKDAVVKIEDEIIGVMESIDTEEKAYKEAEKKFKSDESVLKGEAQSLESKKTEMFENVKKKEDERNEFAKTIPPALLSKYEALRETRGGLAIVPMLNNSCSGCRMKLTPSLANDVKKGKNAVLCESCNRILYLPQEESDSKTLPPNPQTVAHP